MENKEKGLVKRILIGIEIILFIAIAAFLTLTLMMRFI